MSTIKTTASDQTIFLEQDFNSKMVAIKSVGGKTHYVRARNADELSAIGDIRTAETEETVTGATVANGVITYTVADTTKYRKSETLPVLQAGVQVGSIVIREILSSITFSCVQSNGSSFNPSSSDTLVLRQDNFIAEDDINKFASREFKFLKVKSESADVELVVEEMGDGLVKKF